MNVPQPELLYSITVAGTSAVLVGLVRRLVLAHGVIDHPSERSSHVTPTPRGGGLGAVVAILAALTTVGVTTRDVGLLVAIAGCSAVALVGWEDDRRGMPVWSRLIVHLLAAAAVGALSIRSDVPLALGLAIFAWWTFWTVSSINIVNFMDGINGLVASQIAIFAGSLLLFSSQSSGAWYCAAAVAAGCIGFLPWNFPRARIFLGDVGSGALGFLVPMLALLTMREHRADIVQAHLPLLPLFGDAVATIARRWRRGERITQAHRSHLYQRLANGGMGHTRVTLLYAGAAALGAIVAHVEPGSRRWPLTALYVGALLLVARMLEGRLARATR